MIANLSLLLSLLCLQTPAVPLPDFSVPKGSHKVMEIAGDLDKDGIKELVYVYNINKPNGELGFFRELYICKVVDGETKLWKKNTSMLRSSKDCGFCYGGDAEVLLEIKNNTLIIEQKFYHNSRHFSEIKDIFRYQKADWFLIGSNYHLYDTCDFDYTYDINFSTKQVDVSFEYGDCDDEAKKPEDEYYKFKYPFKAVRMDGFKPGNTLFKIPNTKKEFAY